MNIDTRSIISITEANQNFSKVTKMVEKNGIAVIMKNNTPKFAVIDFSVLSNATNAQDEDVLTASEKFIRKNKKVYKELAK